MLDFKMIFFKFKRLLLNWGYRFLFKKSSSSRGQALVEYILLIIVSITLVIGVATKLITPLRDFMQNYAGAYVECLLETGDLPYFLTSNPNSECTFESMEASGRFNASSGGSGGGSNSNRNNNSNSNANRSNASTNNSGRGSNSNGGGSSNSPRPISGSNSGADGSGGDGAGGSAAGGKGAGQDSFANSSANSNNSSGSDTLSGSNLSDTGAGISGAVKVPNTLKNNDVKLTPNKAIKNDKVAPDEELRKSSFSAPFNEKAEKKDGPNLEADMGFNWGMYIRYFIIGGIILALIIMVGTQLNSLRKSWGTAN